LAGYKRAALPPPSEATLSVALGSDQRSVQWGEAIELLAPVNTSGDTGAAFPGRASVIRSKWGGVPPSLPYVDPPFIVGRQARVCKDVQAYAGQEGGTASCSKHSVWLLASHHTYSRDAVRVRFGVTREMVRT